MARGEFDDRATAPGVELPLARGGRSGEWPPLSELKWRRGAEAETARRDRQSL